jgi:hypothetical protein
MTIGNLKLYDIFRKDLHLPDDKALEFVNAMDDHYEKKSTAKIEQLATKAELLAVKSELKQEIHTLATHVDLMATKGELSAAKSDLTVDIQKVKSDLTVDIQKVKSELTGTIYKASIAQFIAIVAAVIGIIRYCLMK